MKITILCSSELHPVNPWIKAWIEKQEEHHEVLLYRDSKSLPNGDILFLISCSELITEKDRSKYQYTLVIHASDLPQGKGWSPHIWSIIEGNTDITVSLLEANDKVDSGDIWHQIKLNIPKDALYDEINRLLFNAELDLMDYAVDNYIAIKPRKQNRIITSTYYQRRTSQDSEIDATKSLEEQFNLIRVCDPERFPAFFKLHGQTYILKIEKVENEPKD